MSHSIMPGNEKNRCYICGRYGQTEEHHIFGGNPNRKHSEEHGLKVYLCPDCHRGDLSVHKNRELRLNLQEEAQAEFEKTHSREEFMAIFGRNYRRYEG